MVPSHASSVSKTYMYNFEMATSHKNLYCFRPVKDVPDLVFDEDDPPLVASGSSYTPSSSQLRSDRGLITNAVDCKGMSWTIVIIPTMIGTMGRFIK